MIPKTNDGRVLFGIPWHNRLILGTTDTPIKDFVMEPEPLEEEIDFVLNTSALYLTRSPKREDVHCVYVGLRPLAAPKRNMDDKKTKEISRRHKLFIAQSGLITITGGKWTTYRQMAQETVDFGIKKYGLRKQKCVTKKLKIHGYKPTVDFSNWRYVYGSDGEKIQALQNETPEYAEKLHPTFDFTVAEVIWAVREEMAITVEDVLSRRIRALVLDARASMTMAPKVAHIMASELNKDESWEKEQIEAFVSLANGYIL
jgi:glycerol-3-phosphate dehydrogenase